MFFFLQKKHVHNNAEYTLDSISDKCGVVFAKMLNANSPINMLNFSLNNGLV